MEISNRLKCVASMIDKCRCIADIGTDHGYLPIYLIKNGVCSTAIASDIKKGPISKAKINIKKYGMEERIECRLGAGLSTINPNEVDCAVISGMGGNLISDIIHENLEVFKSLKYAVLQPVQNPEVLRKYLYNEGFNIFDEELCIDENKYYEIIKVGYDNHVVIKDDIYYEISEKLIEKKHPLIKQYVEYKIKKNKHIIDNIDLCNSNALKRKEELVHKNYILKELFSCLLK
ncbi:tRNA (adenine(22)-N(1))-methyltransferase [Clostridium neuense]|uniref:tRNA (Adenine(22)-N(1))-methyltransferase n=1 Tax=Clostridium neuense TaxID=1728934 RepID=A0ABW8TI59_9CLOT